MSRQRLFAHTPYCNKPLQYGLWGSLVIFLLSHLITNPIMANTGQQIDNELRKALQESINRSSSFEDRFDAEVWLVAQSAKLKRFVSDPSKRIELLQKIHHAANHAGVDPELVLAVIHIESHFDQFAVSRVGAQGMMQVMPFWRREIGRENDNLTDIETNLKYGCAILKHYIDREKGHIANALARYNGSYGSYKYSKKVMDVWLDYWRD